MVEKIVSNPEEVLKIEESHKCGSCENLVMAVEFKNGDTAEIGCNCEVGGEAGGA